MCVHPVSTPWRALSSFCPWASLSPPLLSFCWVRCVHSALIDSHSYFVVLWPLSALLSPLSSRLAMHTMWLVASYRLDGSLGWFVVGSFGCLGVLPSLQSSSTGSFVLRDRLPDPVCLSRILSGFCVLLGLLPPLAFSHSGSSCSTIGWACCGFSCLFRLLSPNPPSLACPGCVLSLMPFHLPWLLRSSGWSVPSFEGILSLWRRFSLLLASPLLCLGSLSGFFPRFSQSVDVSLRSSLGQSYSFPASSFPWGYSHLPLLALCSIILFALLVSPASFPWDCLL